MSKKLEITQLAEINGKYQDVTYNILFKPFMSRASQKKINAIMLGEINIKEAKDQNFNVSIEKLNESEDMAVIEMIAEITINGEKQENIVEFVNNLSSENYELIKESINDITKIKKTLSSETEK